METELLKCDKLTGEQNRTLWTVNRMYRPNFWELYWLKKEEQPIPVEDPEIR